MGEGLADFDWIIYVSLRGGGLKKPHTEPGARSWKEFCIEASQSPRTFSIPKCCCPGAALLFRVFPKELVRNCPNVFQLFTGPNFKSSRLRRGQAEEKENKWAASLIHARSPRLTDLWNFKKMWGEGVKSIYTKLSTRVSRDPSMNLAWGWKKVRSYWFLAGAESFRRSHVNAEIIKCRWLKNVWVSRIMFRGNVSEGDLEIGRYRFLCKFVRSDVPIEHETCTLARYVPTD